MVLNLLKPAACVDTAAYKLCPFQRVQRSYVTVRIVQNMSGAVSTVTVCVDGTGGQVHKQSLSTRITNVSIAFCLQLACRD